MYYIYAGTQKSQPASLPELDIVVVGNLEHQDWFSVYWRGEKVGYTSQAFQRLGNKLILNDVSYLRLPVGGIVQEIYAHGITTYDSSFAIRSFSYEIQGGEYNTTAEGIISHSQLTVIVGSAESKDTMVFPLAGDIYSPSLLPEMFVSAKKTGKELSKIPTFDPFTLSEGQYEIVSHRKARRKVMSKEREVWILTVTAFGMLTEMWVSDDGILLYESGPGGFTQFKEEQSSALAFDLSRSGNLDILTGFAIPAEWNKNLSPRETKYAVYLLKDFPKEILEIEDYNQQTRGDTLIVCSDGFSTENSPLPSDTAEEPFIQCHDKRIHDAANKIVKDEKDSLKMLEKLNKYLFVRIEKDYQTSIPSALDVLDKMRGDCNEHSTLFVALARALSIPSRINVGVVYREDGMFFYHAWVQCYAKGEWHTFDPTFGQAPVDATHIKFLSGNLDKQVQLLRIGKVGIGILEVNKNCK